MVSFMSDPKACSILIAWVVILSSVVGSRSFRLLLTVITAFATSSRLSVTPVLNTFSTTVPICSAASPVRPKYPFTLATADWTSALISMADFPNSMTFPPASDRVSDACMRFPSFVLLFSSSNPSPSSPSSFPRLSAESDIDSTDALNSLDADLAEFPRLSILSSAWLTSSLRSTNFSDDVSRCICALNSLSLSARESMLSLVWSISDCIFF